MQPQAGPVLFVDVDGVLSLFGFAHDAPAPGAFHNVDGILHCIGADCAPRLRRLDGPFEIVWATGWEEKANEYLPHLLEMSKRSYPVLRFDGRAVWGSAHWKLDAIDEYAGERPAAWIDDNLNAECRAWGDSRTAPTLLIQTEPATGIAEEHVQQLLDFSSRYSS